jgi:antitoxin component YwqK of YwqJK toxin-antitoxin module
MIKLTFLLLPAFLFFSCSESTNDIAEDQTESIEEEIVEDTTPDPNAPGDFEEYYPNGALKIKGKNNAEGNREGLWISYYDNGIKWSESYYDNGIKNGHSLTFFPNGGIRYVGEYENDVKIGTWKFYDEAGELLNEEVFE